MINLYTIRAASRIFFLGIQWIAVIYGVVALAIELFLLFIYGLYLITNGG
jgi:hypothetical protein